MILVEDAALMVLEDCAAREEVRTESVLRAEVSIGDRNQDISSP